MSHKALRQWHTTNRSGNPDYMTRQELDDAANQESLICDMSWETRERLWVGQFPIRDEEAEAVFLGELMPRLRLIFPD